MIALESLRALLPLLQTGDEILLVDQTVEHPPTVEHALQTLQGSGALRWIRLSQPSIPTSMNVGLQAAHGSIVLFLDDDIVPLPGLIEAHRRAQLEHALVAGMVLQPGETPCTLEPGQPFRFNSDRAGLIGEFMGGNFSIRRALALSMGGFDQNFIGAAYRYEAEFAHRYCLRFGSIRYEPTAAIHHLQAASGGTRSHGHHLSTVRPLHSVGAYYYLLRARPNTWLWQFLLRPLRAVRTRYHLRNPWRIPGTLVAELRGMWLARQLHLKGPSLLPSEAQGVDRIPSNMTSDVRDS